MIRYGRAMSLLGALFLVLRVVLPGSVLGSGWPAQTLMLTGLALLVHGGMLVLLGRTWRT